MPTNDLPRACDFPVAQFIWGSVKCGDIAVVKVRDIDGTNGWLCNEHKEFARGGRG